MERKFYTDDFEQLLKDKSDEFRMYPSKRVWHSIYNDLHPGRKWPSIAVSMLLVIVLLMMGYWNNNSSKAPVLAAVASSPKNNSTTVTAKAGTVTGAYNDVALQQPVTSAIAYQNQTSIQQPFVIYQNNTTAKTTTALLADNKKVSALQPSINWNIAFEQFNNTATIIPNSSLLNNVMLFSINGFDSKNNTRNTENIDEFDNAVALQQTENSKTIITIPANSNSRIKTGIAIDKKGRNKNGDLLVSTEKDNSTDANLVADNNAEKVDVNTSATALTTITAVNGKATAEQDKAFIDNYAFYNKSKRKKWQDRTALEFYITPSVGYRNLTNDAKYNPPASQSFAGLSANESVNQKPGLGVEAGFDIIYSLAKNLRVKAGVQINYTNYALTADETSHPVLTTLTLTNPNTGFPDLRPATTTLANAGGSDAIQLHNKTYQFSIPLGVALKLSGNNKLEWYAGATIQPTFVVGGKAYLISSDRKNYVADASLIRKWNVNTGIETYISYKFDNFTLQAGPQVRYQLFSTYSNNYTVTEKLYNVGVKIGILKNF